MADENSNTGISIRGLRKTYQNPKAPSIEGIVVFDGFNLEVHNGEFMTLFGPNGCGKSTLLHILAGLIPWDGGILKIDGDEPDVAKVGFVFQSFQATLFPWKRNIDNVAWPLELKGVKKAKRREQARQFLRKMNVSLPENGYPYQLSGGQQQLLSISRALIVEPKVILMDEPFNQLDYQTRMSMHLETLELWERSCTTVLFVSHDIDEALLLGDRIAFLSKRPANVFEILENPLSRPRTHDMLKSQEFFKLKSKALEVFTKALSA